jgi:hypothetical protein
MLSALVRVSPSSHRHRKGGQLSPSSLAAAGGNARMSTASTKGTKNPRARRAQRGRCCAQCIKGRGKGHSACFSRWLCRSAPCLFGDSISCCEHVPAVTFSASSHSAVGAACCRCCYSDFLLLTVGIHLGVCGWETGCALKSSDGAIIYVPYLCMIPVPKWNAICLELRC